MTPLKKLLIKIPQRIQPMRMRHKNIYIHSRSKVTNQLTKLNKLRQNNPG